MIKGFALDRVFASSAKHSTKFEDGPSQEWLRGQPVIDSGREETALCVTFAMNWRVGRRGVC